MLLDSLIFFPDRDMPPTPAGLEDRRIRTSDGETLHAWLAREADERAPVLLWSHGNAGNIGNRAGIVLAFAGEGLGVLAYDYRGYGRSTGRPTETGVYRDAEAAFDSLVAGGVSPERIVCFGESLGGAVSIRLATVRPCRAVAVASAFTSLGDVGRKHYGPLAGLVGSRFDSLSRIRSLEVPLFVAHGDRDEIVPYALGERLFEAANEPREFHRVRGFHHNDVLGAPGLIGAIADFARRSTGPTGPPGVDVRRDSG